MVTTSVENILEILCIFDAEHQEFTAQEIAERIRLPISTTYKFINILIKKGFLQKIDGTSKLVLGLTSMKLGSLVSERLIIPKISRPHMQTLVQRSQETATLTIIDGWNALCIEMIETPRGVRLKVDKGRSVPLHAGASQMILLAYQSDAFIEAMIADVGLPALTEKTITDHDELKIALKMIREKGFAFSDGAFDPGAAAFSAPIFDSSAIAVAGISILGPRERINFDNDCDLVGLLSECAHIISTELGYLGQR